VTFLTAVFSYNRGQLLWNCVTSIEEFSPPTSIAIFDDLSEDPTTREVLDLLARRGHEVIATDGDTTDAVHGNLYANMNRALDLAHIRGFRMLHLVQDDVQLVWRNADLARHVAGILDAFPNAAQVMVHFWRRLGITYPTPLPDHRAYRMTSTGDLGFVDVARLRERGFRFRSSERASAETAASLALEAYAVGDPVVARVPWPMHARHRRMFGGEKAAAAEFLVKPMTAAEQHELRSRGLARLPYGEDYCTPWGWRCWKPYPISPSYASWIKAIGKIAFQRRSLTGLTPRRVGVRDDDDLTG
jgi:hypothetical protein